ncbi:MAG: PAS domain S-box protein [Kiritimatiellae bacterium]|nr:PAS domain S-box protein [Kiritimatiellia bacterium]
MIIRKNITYIAIAMATLLPTLTFAHNEQNILDIINAQPATLPLVSTIAVLLILLVLSSYKNKKKLKQISEKHIEELNEKMTSLEVSEAQYRDIFESSGEGILIADIETTKFASCNKAFCDMLGYSEEEIKTMKVSDIHPTEDLESVIGTFQAQARGDIKLATNIPCVRKDKTIILTNVCTSTVMFNQKPHNIGFFTDISEQHQLMKSYNQLTSAIEQANEVVVITDNNGLIQYVNPAFERVSGYTKKEALGHNPNINKGIGQSEAYYKQMWETISTGNVWTGRFYNKKKDGTEYEEEATISPVKNSNGEIVSYVAVKRDITHESKLESQLRQAQKMEAIGLLAGGLAHDFNNILQVISGYIDIVLSDKHLDDAHKHDLSEVKNASRMASDLTARILSFSRRQAINPINLNLHELVDNTTKMLQRTIGEHIALKIVHGENSRGTALADPAQIEQILINLCINARDAIHDHGTITVTVDSITPGAKHRPNLLLGKDSQCVLLKVSDTGIGMSRSIQEKVFDPFFTTKEPGKGTGLGLASTYGIVKQHKGDIQVHSSPGLGTSFSIYLPEIEMEKVIAEEKIAKLKPAGGTETILVAEDHADVRNFVNRILTNAGYTTITAVDGEDAINLFDANKDTIDFALLDIIMPKCSGYGVLKHIQEHDANFKFLFTSGYTDGTIPTNLETDEEYELLSKPYSPPELLTRVRALLDA